VREVKEGLVSNRIYLILHSDIFHTWKRTVSMVSNRQTGDAGVLKISGLKHELEGSWRHNCRTFSDGFNAMESKVPLGVSVLDECAL